MEQDSIESRVADMIMGEDEVAEEEAEEQEIEASEEEELEASDEASDDDDEDVPDSDDPEDLGLVEVEYDGVVYEVPSTLKDALLRQSDYTQKTQSVAQEREQVEVLRKQVEVTQKEQQFVQEIQPDLNNMGYLQAHIQQVENDLQTNLSNMTSEEMFKKKIEVDGYKEQLKALNAALEAKYKDFEEAQKQSYEELLNKGAQVLKRAIPDWNETKQAEVRDFALAKGFTQQEVSSIIDPRHVEILWAASQYEAIKGKAKPTAETLKAAPKIKPKARNPMSKEVRNRLDLKNKLKSKKLSAREKAQAVAEDFGNRFG